MRITLSNDSLTTANVDLLVVPVATKKILQDENVARLDKAMGKVLEGLAKDEGFEAKPGQTLKVPGRGRVKAKWVALVGVSKDEVKAARTIAHHTAKQSARLKSAAILLPTTNPATVRAATESIVQGDYAYAVYKTGTRKPKKGLTKAAFLVSDNKDKALKAAIKAGVAVGESVNLARDMVNAPPNDFNPITLADLAKEEAEKLGLKITIWDKKKIIGEGMNLFAAVNRGSSIEPRLIHISYEPPNPTHSVAFVGKGLTFDAGGLCLKPAKSMVDMKCDMAGSAVTLGVVLAAARLRVPVTVHAIIGSTENMLGADAYRPGDVFTSYEGKTVEIINTDAEGRLVLADVLAWTAQEIKADYIIDHATLTGACMVGLGAHRAGLYANDDDLRQAYEMAAELSDEKYWHMPLDKDLRPTLDSFIADLKHTGSPYGGSITAALFLQEFIGKSKWMHIDIAGPAFNSGIHGTAPKGGTGFGVSTGVRFLEYLGLDCAEEN